MNHIHTTHDGIYYRMSSECVLSLSGQIPSGGNELKSLINGLKKEKRSPIRKQYMEHEFWAICIYRYESIGLHSHLYSMCGQVTRIELNINIE